jgi:hypothetical protein
MRRFVRCAPRRTAFRHPWLPPPSWLPQIARKTSADTKLFKLEPASGSSTCTPRKDRVNKGRARVIRQTKAWLLSSAEHEPNHRIQESFECVIQLASYKRSQKRSGSFKWNLNNDRATGAK